MMKHWIKVAITLVLLSAAIVSVVLHLSEQEIKRNPSGYRIVVIDQCQYIRGAFGVTHKGDCVNCVRKWRNLLWKDEE